MVNGSLKTTWFSWIPAFAGMTEVGAGMTKREIVPFSSFPTAKRHSRLDRESTLSFP